MLNIIKLPVLMMLLLSPSLSHSQAQQLQLQPQAEQQHCQPENIVATTPSSRFQRHGDGTVTDKETGLMWRVCVEGLAGKNCEKGTPIELTWAGALTYPPKLNSSGGFAGYKDWRLPNIRELSTLAELQCARPAINLDVFPNTSSAHVWSSSPFHFYTHYSWYVDFEDGQFTEIERIKAKQIRLVRSAQ